MEHFFELLITVMIAVLGSNGLWAYIQSVSKTKTAKDRMLLGLGHAEIFRTAEKYIERDGITTDELEDLEKYLYKPYKEMAGTARLRRSCTSATPCRSSPLTRRHGGTRNYER